MNALFVPERGVYVCPACKDDLYYWASHDVLLCESNCEGEVYDPDTGEVQGSVV